MFTFCCENNGQNNRNAYQYPPAPQTAASKMIVQVNHYPSGLIEGLVLLGSLVLSKCT